MIDHSSTSSSLSFITVSSWTSHAYLSLSGSHLILIALGAPIYLYYTGVYVVIRMTIIVRNLCVLFSWYYILLSLDNRCSKGFNATCSFPKTYHLITFTVYAPS